MANVSRPTGFKPFKELLRVTPYRSAGAIYPGDPVTLDVGAANTTDMYARVICATAQQALIGVAIGYASAAGKEILVADHPDQLFIAEADEADLDDNADLGQTHAFVAASPDTTYKVSRAVLDSSEVGTATYPFRTLGYLRAAAGDNVPGADVKVIVAINNHQLKGGTGTATV